MEKTSASNQKKIKYFYGLVMFIILSLIFGLNISRYKKKLNKK